MPEFILNNDANVFPRKTFPPALARAAEFATGYVEAMFFTNGDCGSEDEELLNNLGTGRLTKESRENIKRECLDFLAYKPDDKTSIYDILVSEPGGFDRAGGDFWFTRQGHGTGFWDRDDNVYSEQARDALDKAAKSFGESYVEVWRGWIHVR